MARHPYFDSTRVAFALTTYTEFSLFLMERGWNYVDMGGGREHWIHERHKAADPNKTWTMKEALEDESFKKLRESDLRNEMMG
jgi:hypothetical protein